MSPTSSPSSRPDAALPACVSRGDRVRQAPLAHGPDRGEPVAVFACGVFGDCTEFRLSDGVACCAACPRFRPRDPRAAVDSPQNSVEAMIEALRGPPHDWPDDWPFWWTTVEAHRRLAAEFADQIQPYPAGRFRGRGIVIPG